MSRPIEKQSHSGATSAGPGDAFHTKGHNALGLAVDATSLDSANDTLEVRLEVEVGGAWHATHNEDGTRVGQLTASDLGSNGHGLLYLSNVPAPKIRANVTSFNDASDSGTTPVADLTVDTYVLGTGWSSSGQEYET